MKAIAAPIVPIRRHEKTRLIAYRLFAVADIRNSGTGRIKSRLRFSTKGGGTVLTRTPRV